MLQLLAGSGSSKANFASSCCHAAMAGNGDEVFKYADTGHRPYYSKKILYLDKKSIRFNFYYTPI
jgi:hypothetical protein